MSSARRLLIAGGIALAPLGMIYGLWYAVFAEHQELDELGKSLATGFSAAAERNSAAAQSALNQYREMKYAYDRLVDVHVALLHGFGGTRMTAPEKTDKRIFSA